MSSSFRRDSDRDYDRREYLEGGDRYAPPRYEAQTSRRREEDDLREDPGPSTAGPSVEPRVYQRVDDDDDDSSIHAPPPPVQPASIRIERTRGRSRSDAPPRPPPVAQAIRLPELSRTQTPIYQVRESPPSPDLVIENAPHMYDERSYAVPPGRLPPGRLPPGLDPNSLPAYFRPGPPPRGPPPGPLPPSPHRRYRPEIRMEVPRPPRGRPPIRLVPPGFVRPAPYLPPSERLHSHDLTGIAQGPDPKSDPKVRENLVLCVYRNSKKSFDYRFVKLVSGHGRKDVVITDRSLFHNMRYIYENELRGWIRRFFSFKGLTTVRLLQYGAGQLFRPKQDDDLFSLTFMKFWWNPDELLLKDTVDWIEWIREAKNLHREFDMAIELIEDYIPERIVFFIGLGLIAIVALTAAWLIKGGEPGNVSTVMSFVLTFVAAVVALTTIWDHFDGGRSKEIRERAVVVLPGNFKDVPEGTPFYKPNFINPKGKEYIKEKEDEKD